MDAIDQAQAVEESIPKGAEFKTTSPETDTRPSISEIRKRGRPLGSKTRKGADAPSMPASKPACSIFTPAMCAGLSNTPFAIMGYFTRNEKWNLEEEDKIFLGSPLADLMNDLWPELTSKYPKTAVFAVMFSAVLMKKSAQMASLKRPSGIVPKKEEARAGDNVQANTSVFEKSMKEVPLQMDGITTAEQILKARNRGESI